MVTTPDTVCDLRNYRLQVNQRLGEPVWMPSYTVAGVPAAADWTASWIYVTNETGGAVPAFSDGMNWRRCTDRAIIS